MTSIGCYLLALLVLTKLQEREPQENIPGLEIAHVGKGGDESDRPDARVVVFCLVVKNLRGCIAGERIILLSDCVPRCFEFRFDERGHLANRWKEESESDLGLGLSHGCA